MCIIIFKEADKSVKKEWLDNSAKSNPDGFGMSYIDDETGLLKIYKSMSYKKFYKTFRKAEINNPDSSFVLHFRKNTVGTTTVDNCHPFIVNDDIVMFHNGTIKPAIPDAKSGDKRSDSRIFAEDTLAGLPDGWMDNDAICDLIEEYVSGSKLALMHSDGTVLLINEEAGHWYEGVWMSNYSYYPNTRSIQKTKPLTWDANLKDTTTPRNIIYKHPDGEMTRYINKRRFMWDSVREFWFGIDRVGKRIYDLAVRYGDYPHASGNTIQPVSYGINNKAMDTSKQLSHPVHLYCKCGWCGKITHRSGLGAYSIPTGVNDVDVELLCGYCAKDLEMCGIDKLKHYNIDYLMNAANKTVEV